MGSKILTLAAIF